MPLANAAEGKGLSKLWARRKIADAEVARTMRQASPEEADKTILALALEHQLVTRLTSLVAVDKTPSRPEGEPLKVSELPVNLPAGWDFTKVFGERPRLPAAPIERRAGADDARVQVAALKRPVVVPTPNTVTLPKTATDAELKMITGSILLALSLIAASVQPTSEFLALTPDERGGTPTSSFRRARPPVPRGRARDFFCHSGMVRRTRPGISRFRVRCYRIAPE